jgi:ATP-dependent RNA helicase DOB1
VICSTAAEKEARAKAAAAPPSKPAKTYPFTLDPFQARAIQCLERQQSVLVSAHTSAGKTVVAQYAIAMSLRDNQRVIYTSPIKALSNQKYRELYEEFQDVGLMTGDVTINPSATVLVMTTEILRNMLYRGSEIMREVGWLVFDEVHYMRDKERGVVWEETIILLPDKVHYVFLSATIPNSTEFAHWIAKLHKQPCNVVYTDYRPTPLQHYLFPAGADGLYLTVDEKGNFREDNFQKALSVLNAAEGPDLGGDKPKAGKKKQNKGPPDILKILRMIMERKYNPVIVFSFSKRECEQHAQDLAKLDFSSEDEKKLIGQIFVNAIDSLSDDDKKLPQVQNILPLLKRGIGIHHSGLLPILKEVVEILFQEGLLKALFSTETFSMGLNMPAKTVVFTSVRKYDGAEFRMVTSGEYIQMSGRAGRRGLDDRGIVILMLDEKMEPAAAKTMLKGAADCLNSSFHLGYNMLLNLTRVEEADPQYMIARSFHQFQAQRAAPQMIEQMQKWQATRDAIVLPNEGQIAEYYKIKAEIRSLEKQIRAVICEPINILPFLNPGRMVQVKDGDVDWGWGVVAAFQKIKKGTTIDDGAVGSQDQYEVDVLLRCDSEATSGGKFNKPTPCPAGKEGVVQVVPVLLSLINQISSIRVFVARDLKSAENRKAAGKSLAEVAKRFPDGLPLLDPVEDMKIADPVFLKNVQEIERYEHRLLHHPLFTNANLKELYATYEKKVKLETQITALQEQVRKLSESVVHRTTLRNMRRLLKKLGFLSTDGVVTLKGRVACEISTADELLASELLFGGTFNTLEVDQAVALVSCLVYTEKADDMCKLRDELMSPLRQLQEVARRIAKASTEASMPLDETEYVTSFKPQMMEVTYAWCRGAKFVDVCKMTDIFEGSVIRTLRRLEEVLRQMATASKIIGNGELEAKFEEGIKRIKRDVVFSASLFL